MSHTSLSAIRSIPFAVLGAAVLIGMAAAPRAQPADGSWALPASTGATVPAALEALVDHVLLDGSALPTSAWETGLAASYDAVDIRTIVAEVAARVGLAASVAPGIETPVTLDVLAEPSVITLARLAAAADLVLVQAGPTFVLAPHGWAGGSTPLLSSPPSRSLFADPPPPASGEPGAGGAPTADALSLSLQGDDIAAVAETVAQRTGLVVGVRPGVSGTLSGRFGPSAPLVAFEAALAGNGFALAPTLEGYEVVYPDEALTTTDGMTSPAEGRAGPGVAGGIAVADGLVSLDVTDMPVLDVVRAVAVQAGLNVVTHATEGSYSTVPETRVSAQWAGVPVEEALGALLYGTTLTHKRQGSVLVVGDRVAPAMATTRLLRLRHVPAARALERLPETFRQGATFQAVPEQNALLVTGPQEAVAQAERFVAELDEYAPQVLIEALVVEFETSELKELGVTLLGGLLPPGTNLPTDVEPDWRSILFGGGADARGGLDVLADAAAANKPVNFWGDLLGITNLGRLPSDFYVRLQALDRAGHAHVRSRPHLVTMNGNPATITVGTSQYYILKSAGAGPPGFPTGYETERFERVDANVELSVTPWLTGSGEVTAEIRPRFATPVGGLDPRVPPTLSTWSVESLVRLREGETIILGGLVQEREGRAENRVPLLGRIPLLGRLFRNSQKTKSKSELVIFLTPHVFWGDGEGERARWERLERDLGRDAPLRTPAEERQR